MGVKKIKKKIQTGWEDTDAEQSKIVTGLSSTGTRVVSFDKDDNTAKIQIKKANEIPASLVLLAGPAQLVGYSWSLDRDVLTVGRSYRSSNVSIPEDSMSKIHFQVQFEDGKVFIIDLNSTNKTFLDNEALVSYKKYSLENNSQIRAGNAIFKFLEKGTLESLSHKSVLDRTHTDALTGLLNKAALQIKGEEIFNSKKHFCVIAFDIDHFKKINDNHGHLAGDLVLKKLAQQVNKIIRDNDQAFRYGGEEFCIFTDNSYEIAKNISERIREKIEKYTFEFQDTPINMTLSLGVTSVSSEDTKWEDVYARADKYLYEAKNSGRNKVVAKED